MQKPIIVATLLMLLASLAMPGNLRAQLVWPGDVNNNGIVNGVDALYIALALDATGPERADRTGNWAGVIAPEPWSQAFPSGQNYYYADCNGDGEVKLEDVDEGVEENFLQTHGTRQPDGYANASSGAGPALRLVPNADMVGEDVAMVIEVFVGEEENPIEDFYGVALELSYGAAAGSNLDELTFSAEPNSWVDPTEENNVVFFYEDATNGKAYLTLSRTDQQTIPGGGKVGEFSIIMEDIVLGREVDTFTIQIDSVLLVNTSLQAKPAVPDTASVTITKNPNRVSAAPEQIITQIYPNPARQVAFLNMKAELSTCELYNARGQAIPLRVEWLTTLDYQLVWPEGLSAGMYYLRLTTTGGRTQSQKLLIY